LTLVLGECSATAESSFVPGDVLVDRLQPAKNRASIHIEQRPPVEATMVRGLVKGSKNNEQAVVQVTPSGIGSDEGKPWQQVSSQRVSLGISSC
jgi:hypothetical protein